MAERVIVVPAHPNAKIPDPDHQRFLPPDGMEVNWSPYWERHVRQGNVTVKPIEAALPADVVAAEPGQH